MRFIPICITILFFSAVIGTSPYQLKKQSTKQGILYKLNIKWYHMFVSYSGPLSTKRDDSPNYNDRFESMLKWLDTEMARYGYVDMDSLEQMIGQFLHNG